MSEKNFRFSVEPRPLTHEEILGISDPHEREFGLAALQAGLEVSDGGMITLNTSSKYEKASTNPDFYIDGVFVEITRGENLNGRKLAQKKVMDKAQLPYVQLTGSQIEALTGKTDLRSALLQLLRGT